MNIIIATLKKWDIYHFQKICSLFPQINFILISNEKQLNSDFISLINPRYIFFTHWSFIIPKTIYQNYECVIFHMSDLPYGRGGSPLQNLILQKNKTTKISAIKANSELDGGDVYLKYNLNISRKNAKKIYKNASKIIFFKMIPYIFKNNPKPIPQSGKISIFKRRTPEQSNLICLNNPNLEKIFDFIRMLDAPSYPKAFLKFENIKIEFKNVKNKKNQLIGRFKIYEE
ncbi:methionyl-tRNA formyltransferase [Campylobacter sp. LH-2024]|uniref:methionyl-tRNA formyltransferase n=1 Tax=Campylobacter TaxID=194 RepID=UPI00301C0622|nr:methionyl-tRNA formyltransferase [Campylobacter sp. W0046]